MPLFIISALRLLLVEITTKRLFISLYCLFFLVEMPFLQVVVFKWFMKNVVDAIFLLSLVSRPNFATSNLRKADD